MLVLVNLCVGCRLYDKMWGVYVHTYVLYNSVKMLKIPFKIVQVARSNCM